MIDLVATTEVQGFNITLNLGGTLERPDIHLASDANLADLEIFSLIAAGPAAHREPAGAPHHGRPAGPGRPARPRSSSMDRRRRHLQAGRHPLPLRPLPDRPRGQAGQPVSGVGITVGKRLSKDVFVTYSSVPTTNQQYIVQVEWRVRNNLTLVLTQVGDGTYAVDAQWQRRF